MIRWFRHQKLIHQIAVVVLAGFCISFLLSFYLLSAEKAERLNRLSVSGAVQRVISVVSILAQTPPSLHLAMIQASNSSDLHLSVSATPQIEETRPVSSESTLLLNRIAAAGISEAYLTLTPRMQQEQPLPEMHHGMMAGNGRSKEFSNKEYRNRRLRFVATMAGSVRLPDGGWLNFSSGVNPEITHWSAGVLISLSLVVAGTILICLLIIRNALRPVRALEKAAEDFATHKSVTQISTDCPQDLYPTIQAFNEMQVRLTGYIDDRTKLLAAISHDLRTPLTSLRLRLEFIEEGEDKQQMLRTLTVMENMLQATMRFSRDDVEPEPRCPTAVDTLMQTIVDEYAEKQIVIDYQPGDLGIWSVPPLSIRRMTENLVNNAIQYGGQGCHISLEVRRENQYLSVTVADNGPGIDAAKFDDMMKPFTRLNQARDTESASVGLGLSITRSLAVAHGGTLRLTTNQPHGLKATFTVLIGREK
ncbi:Sensor protein RstB [Vibrio aerogenes CECT 7868]|uniref:histidine kinase n=1 Tax=Vibrio aerogenes CECT 7868 TaxID=1216006 RepID=A0A1M6AZA8_9VIBR|nr:HAMP domain-containing sensor histidine kinase [Vibrio aerogenes]SHI41648.1 Sensor protein RstB [Vibrio aerogenes CECT 7868]